ncbi:hypothetical protein C8J57DRAFT_1612124 [Mycena rebaudengoi]|nr:hypothetical protein C8J57DRAFT_1612124 [Mycena rebaudengoi]
MSGVSLTAVACGKRTHAWFHLKEIKKLNKEDLGVHERRHEEAGRPDGEVFEHPIAPCFPLPRSRLLGHPPPLASDRYRSPPPSSCDSPQPDTARSPLASFCSCRSGPPGSRRPPPSALGPHHWTYSTTFSSRTRPSSDWTPHAPAPPRPPPRHARFRHPLPQPPSYPPKAVLFPPVSPRAIPSESNPLNNRPPQHGATTRSFSSGYRCTVQNP